MGYAKSLLLMVGLVLAPIVLGAMAAWVSSFYIVSFVSFTIGCGYVQVKTGYPLGWLSTFMWKRTFAECPDSLLGLTLPTYYQEDWRSLGLDVLFYIGLYYVMVLLLIGLDRLVGRTPDIFRDYILTA